MLRQEPGFELWVAVGTPGFILDESHDIATRLHMNDLYGNFLKALYTMFETQPALDVRTHQGSLKLRTPA